jgi:hypothetical protein
MFAVQASWTFRIHWREATPLFGPPTNEVIGTKDAVLKITAAQKRTVILQHILPKAPMSSIKAHTPSRRHQQH